MNPLAKAAALAVVAGGLALPSAASAATTCTYEASGIVSVAMSASNDAATLRTTPQGEIQIEGASGGPIGCSGGTPTVVNTDNILVYDGPGVGQTNVTVERPTYFAPGRTKEQSSSALSEIEFILNLSDGDDRLTVKGELGADDWELGRSRMNWNAGNDDPAAPDSEVLFAPLQRVFLEPLAGDDHVDAQGGAATGDPYDRDGLQVNGDLGADTVRGGDASDSLVGGAGADNLSAFAGDDGVYGNENDDVLDGGAGIDTTDYSAAPDGATVDLSRTDAQPTGEGNDTLSTIEDVIGSPKADTLTGGDGRNALSGAGGDDRLDGRGGDDILVGSIGNDTAAYTEAPAGVSVDLAAGTTSGGAGADTLSGVENLSGSGFADALLGDAEPNKLTGNGGQDTLVALAGADTIDVRDGGADAASCGSEADIGIADQPSLDAVNEDCEGVQFLPEPPEAPLPDGPEIGEDLGAGIPFPDVLAVGEEGAVVGPLVRLTGTKALQRVLRQKGVAVTATCPDEACSVLVSTTGRFAAGPLTKRLQPGESRKLKVKFSKRQLSAVKRALRGRKKPTLKVSVVAIGEFGAAATSTRSVSVKR